jgi:hypothetical protein
VDYTARVVGRPCSRPSTTLRHLVAIEPLRKPRFPWRMKLKYAVCALVLATAFTACNDGEEIDPPAGSGGSAGTGGAGGSGGSDAGQGGASAGEGGAPA